MAHVRIPEADEAAGTVRPGEPMARPYVVLADGTVMSYKEWGEKGNPY